MRRLRAGLSTKDSWQSHPVGQFYQKPFDIAYEEVSKKRALRQLEQLFHECDEDGSGGMTLEELQKSLKQIAVKKTFAQLGVQPHQSAAIFKYLDKSKSGELTINAFIGGLTELIDLDACSELSLDVLRARHRPNKSRPVTKVELMDQMHQRMYRPSRSEYHNAYMSKASSQALHSAMATWRVQHTPTRP